ncbi:uncharacterized protein LOC141605513 [Silene latifolia]|uniref:uncharacterized protein LOC141605513 n=1 Tax=Silene latifolia TaxID=37657 RepID=UPI003D77D491
MILTKENMNPTSIVEHSKQNTSPMEYPPKQNPSSISETSQEIPTTLYNHSKEKTTTNFSFQVHPAIILKQTLACLTEEHFNPEGFGMIEVGEVGLEITVGNSNATVSHLWLKATGLIDFKCSKPMIGQWVNLKHISHNLVDAHDTDTITIHHLESSNQLFFSFGSDPPTQFSEELVEQDEVYYVKFPNITYACEAAILSDDLKQMIEQYEVAEPKLVLVDISKENLKISIERTKWLYCYKHGDKMEGIRGMIGKQKHHAFFKWPDCEFLKKAALVAPAFLLCFATHPPQCIMLRFNLRELGDLVYLHKSVLTVFNSPSSQQLKVELGNLENLKAASLV